MMASAGEGAGIEGALMGVTVHKPDGYTQDKIDAAKKKQKTILQKSLWID